MSAQINPIDGCLGKPELQSPPSFEKDSAVGESSLTKAIAEIYGIVPAAVIERRTVVGIVDKDGRKWLWKPAVVSDDEVRLAAMAEMTTWLTPEIVFAGPVANQMGRYLSHVSRETVGYLQPWLIGRHLNPRVDIERLAAMEVIGKLHRLTQVRAVRMNGLQRGSLIGKLRLKTKAVTELWPELRKHSVMMASVETAIRRKMEEVLTAYERVAHFPAVIGRTSVPQAFCHRDLAPHNLLWQEGRVAMIDFDHAGYDDPLHDAIQFISHCLFLSNPTNAQFHELVTTYEQAAALPPERQQLFRQLLAWPDIFIRTAVEWSRQGCPISKEARIFHAIQKEHRRSVLLRTLPPI